MKPLTTHSFPEHSLAVDWHLFPAQRRTVWTRYGTERVDVPPLAFAVVRNLSDAIPVSLSVFESCIASGSVKQWAFSPGAVCLGDVAARDIVAGTLHPVDAFWFTQFRWPWAEYVAWCDKLGDRRSVWSLEQASKQMLRHRLRLSWS
jgi:hypothetical protein